MAPFGILTLLPPSQRRCTSSTEANRLHDDPSTRRAAYSVRKKIGTMRRVEDHATQLHQVGDDHDRRIRCSEIA